MTARRDPRGFPRFDVGIPPVRRSALPPIRRAGPSMSPPVGRNVSDPPPLLPIPSRRAADVGRNPLAGPRRAKVDPFLQ